MGDFEDGFEGFGPETGPECGPGPEGGPELGLGQEPGFGPGPGFEHWPEFECGPGFGPGPWPEPEQLLYLDCQSGIAGDMLVAALLDLGASEEAVRAALKSLPIGGFEVEISRVKKAGIDCCDFNVVLDAEHDGHDHDMAWLHGGAGDDPVGEPGEHVHGHGHGEHAHGHDHGEHAHGHRGLPEVEAIIDAGALTPGARELARRAFRILAEAEARAHALPVEQVHFHEVGAVDSIVDIVAAAVALDDLGIRRVVVPVLVDGYGSVRCQHGVIPVPAPATLNICIAHGLPLAQGQVEGELVTPTGAALVAALRPLQELPARYRVRACGLGAGKRAYARPSVLRAMIIDELEPPAPRPGAGPAPAGPQAAGRPPHGPHGPRGPHQDGPRGPHGPRPCEPCGPRPPYEGPGPDRPRPPYGQPWWGPAGPPRDPQDPHGPRPPHDGSRPPHGPRHEPPHEGPCPPPVPDTISGAPAPGPAFDARLDAQPEPPATGPQPGPQAPGPQPDQRECCIVKLECDIDDSTGEQLAYAAERLREAGAREVHWLPLLGKKGRPAWQLQVLCMPEDVGRLEQIVFAETSTIGIRRQRMERTVLPRDVEVVQTVYGPVRCKMVVLPDGAIRMAPEYEDCAAIAREQGVALRQVMEAALEAAEREEL